jgi:hypothetical protein
VNWQGPQSRNTRGKQGVRTMMATREAPKPGTLLRRGAVIKAVDSNARTMRFVASDESVDRYGDIIRVSGWQLDNFRKNPVLLFAHDSRQPPVGQVPTIEVVGTELIADCLFRAEGDSQLSDDVWRAVEGGFLRAVSVGFTPTGPINELVDSTGNWTCPYHLSQPGVLVVKSTAEWDRHD